MKLALVKSTEVARTIGSSSTPTTPDGKLESRPSWLLKGRSASAPVVHSAKYEDIPHLSFPSHISEAYNAVKQDLRMSVGALERFLNRIGS